MVARIKTCRNLRQVLNYNEKKVQRNAAKLIHAENFLGDISKLNFNEKFIRLEKLNELNLRSEVNTLHVSLNFHPLDKLDQETQIAIAKKYIEAIGFRDQPYLVYQHLDAAHPHMHIVSSLIKSNGKRIRTQSLGRDQSSKARTQIEKEFGLVHAASQKNEVSLLEKPVTTQKVTYGKSETRNAIQNVLNHVVNDFKYTSIAELNAVLRFYNIRANTGLKDSRIAKTKGLLYHVLEPNGNPVGVPIKASDFFNKPTLKNLELKFEKNLESRNELLPKIKSKIDWVLISRPKNLEQFQTGLRKENIELVIRQNADGIIYGLTYIDFNSKCVANGSDLGKQYSAKQMLEQLSEQPKMGLTETKKIKQRSSIDQPQYERSSVVSSNTNDLLADIVRVEKSHDDPPYEISAKKKRRKKIKM